MPWFPNVEDPMQQVVLVGKDTARPYKHATSRSEPSNCPSLSIEKDPLDGTLGRTHQAQPQQKI